MKWFALAAWTFSGIIYLSQGKSFEGVMLIATGLILFELADMRESNK